MTRDDHADVSNQLVSSSIYHMGWCSSLSCAVDSLMPPPSLFSPPGASLHQILVLIASVSSENKGESVYVNYAQILHCSHTQSIDVVEGSDQTLDLCLLEAFGYM